MKLFLLAVNEISIVFIQRNCVLLYLMHFVRVFFPREFIRESAKINLVHCFILLFTPTVHTVDIKNAYENVF